MGQLARDPPVFSAIVGLHVDARAWGERHAKIAVDDNELERVEGYESVTLRESGRTATGDRLSYLAADEQYDMTGVPVRIVQECRETTGRMLTFYKAVDRILVDGQQITRTRTKSGADCPDKGRAPASAPAR